MPRTQRLIVASLALVIGLGFGFFLAGLFDFNKLAHPHYDTQASITPMSASDREFKLALETVIKIEQKDTLPGFTPQMLMYSFPRLVSEDFASVAAVVGQYEYKDGQLIYTNTEVVDGVADNISDEGIHTLKENIYRRLQIAQDENLLSVIDILKSEAVATTSVPTIPPVTPSDTLCPKDAKLCRDGSSVGREGATCEFAACPVLNDRETVSCTDAQRDALCTEQYEPVCAAYQVQCITTPCNPVPKNYGNGCSACADRNVGSYQTGECPLTSV